MAKEFANQLEYLPFRVKVRFALVEGNLVNYGPSDSINGQIALLFMLLFLA